jgi:hypothetical protein
VQKDAKHAASGEGQNEWNKKIVDVIRAVYIILSELKTGFLFWFVNRPFINRFTNISI